MAFNFIPILERSHSLKNHTVMTQDDGFVAAA